MIRSGSSLKDDAGPLTSPPYLVPFGGTASSDAAMSQAPPPPVGEVSSSSPTEYWIGGSSGDWFVASNWENASTLQYGVPNAGDVVDTLSAAMITTDGATVAELHAGGVLVGDLTVTGLAFGGTYSGGNVSAGVFADATFEGDSLSAGLIDSGARIDGGTISASQIVFATLSGATVTAGELARDGTDFLAVTMIGGTLTASLHTTAYDDTFTVSGGTATLTGKTVTDGGGQIDLISGTMIFQDGLVLSGAELTQGDANASGFFGGGTVRTPELVVADGGAFFQAGPGARLIVARDVDVGETGSANFYGEFNSGGCTIGGDLKAGVGEHGSGDVTLAGVEIKGGLQLGVSGSATCLVESADVDGDVQLGVEAGGYGELDGDLTVGGNVTVGAAGTGELYLGRLDDSAGDVTVGDEADATGDLSFASGGVLSAGTLTVGAASHSATLEIFGGEADVIGDLTLGDEKGASGTITGGYGAALDVGGDVTVGAEGKGKLALAIYRTPDVEATFSGDLTLGEEKGAQGTMTLSGAQVRFAGDMTIGDAGRGTLSITSGGGVVPGGVHVPNGASDAITLGEKLGGKGVLTIAGAKSVVRSRELVVGAAGGGTLAVRTGATLDTVEDATLAEDAGTTVQKATVTAADWSIGADLAVGDAASGSLAVAGGGLVTVGGDLTVGGQGAAAGTLSVSGALVSSGQRVSASELIWGGVLAVGEAGVGTLKIGGGALVSAASGGSGAMEIGVESGATGSVAVTGSGTVLSGATLAVGGSRDSAGGSATLTVGAGASARFGATTVWNGGRGVAGGTVRLGATVDDGLLQVTAGTLTVGGALTGSGAVSVGSAGVFMLNAASTSDANRVRLSVATGRFSLTGGSGGDLFLMRAADLKSTDRVAGGAGADVVRFTTAGTVTASALAGVSGVDEIDLADGANTLTLNAAMAARSDADAVTVEGGAGNDRVSAAALSTSAGFTFSGGGGHDVVHGGKGDNVYVFDSSTSATLAVTNAYVGGTSAHGTLRFGAGLTDQKLWLVRQGSSLVVEEIGTMAKVTLAGWFGANRSARVAEITAAGLKLDAGVQNLVAAMATYEEAHPAFNPQASGATMPRDAQLQAAITRDWHS